MESWRAEEAGGQGTGLEAAEVSSSSVSERLGKRLTDLLFDLSARFVHLPAARIDDEIREGLRFLGEILEVDRGNLWELTPEEIQSTHAWALPGAELDLEKCQQERQGWGADLMRRGEVFTFSHPSELPDTARLEKSYFVSMGIRSCLAIPISWEGSVTAMLTFIALHRSRHWPGEVIQHLRLLGEIFWGALARKRAEESLRASQELNQAVLNSLRSEVAVLDQEGKILAVNDSWEQFGRAAGVKTGPIGVGLNYLNYLQICRSASEAGAEDASRTLGGIQSVLDGKSELFELEYASPTPSGVQWFVVSVTPFGSNPRRAVVLHTDVTERKRVEATVRLQQAELAHAARAATLGELAAALAHEINQPLAAVAANAQAAHRFLATGRMDDLNDLDEILKDISGDALRAGEIIRRLGSLLRKGELEKHPLDVNEVTRSVEVFARADALQSGAVLRMDLAADLPAVLGDRVQLQQVLLNLIHNGIEAMKGTERPRLLIVETSGSGHTLVTIEVRDAGPPLPEDVFRRMFDPFYSTKPGGLGMGLSISRSIIEAHGGRLWAEPNPGKGIAVRFTLPAGKDDPDGTS